MVTTSATPTPSENVVPSASTRDGNNTASASGAASNHVAEEPTPQSTPMHPALKEADVRESLEGEYVGSSTATDVEVTDETVKSFKLEDVTYDRDDAVAKVRLSLKSGPCSISGSVKVRFHWAAEWVKSGTDRGKVTATGCTD